MFGRLENELAIVTRHLNVLEAITEYEPIGLITLSNRLSYPTHKIRYSLRVLQVENLVKSTPEGIVTTDQMTDFHEDTTEQLTDVAQTVARLQVDESSPAVEARDSASAD